MKRVYVQSEHLKMAYLIMTSVNNGGRICTPQNFARRAFEIYRDEIAKNPHLLTILDRALRKLAAVHPDVIKIRTGEYVLRTHEKACEMHRIRLMMGRCGGNI